MGYMKRLSEVYDEVEQFAGECPTKYQFKTFLRQKEYELGEQGIPGHLIVTILDDLEKKFHS